jgi:hypothetical protein
VRECDVAIYRDSPGRKRDVALARDSAVGEVSHTKPDWCGRVFMFDSCGVKCHARASSLAVLRGAGPDLESDVEATQAVSRTVAASIRPRTALTCTCEVACSGLEPEPPHAH